MDLLLQTGYRKPIPTLTLNDRMEIVPTLLDYHLMLEVKSVMDQFKEGVNEVGLLEDIQKNPLLWEPLFVHMNNPLTIGM